MTVITISGDDLVALGDRHLHADNDRFLADIEVAETADEPHAVKLPGLLLETADQQHLPIGAELCFLSKAQRFRWTKLVRGWPGAAFARGRFCG